MYITVKLPLNLDENLAHSLLWYENIYHAEIKRIASIFIDAGHSYEYLYKNISNHISFSSKHLVLEYAKKEFQKQSGISNVKTIHCSSSWSNSSYKISDNCLMLELGLFEHRNFLSLPYYQNLQPLKQLRNGKMMNLNLIMKDDHWYAYISLDIPITYKSSQKAMGIDIGMKVPAVAAINDKQYRFFGNGRERQYILRKYKRHIREMQQRKQYKKLRKFHHKLHNILMDQDHKIAKDIVAYAEANDIGIIKLERLTAIHEKFNVHQVPNAYLWSYSRLQSYIAYKAKLSGIHVIYVNPYNTSKRCPKCGCVNKAKDRNYQCECGFHGHRDVVAAINILHAL